MNGMGKTLRHRTQVQRAMAHIDACLLTDPITMPKMVQIAKEAGASSFHLHRLFLAFVGETPIEYFNKRRLESAALILADGKGASLLELAIRLGFEGHASFTTAFKKRFGTTPSDFAKNPNSVPFKAGGPRKFLVAGVSVNASLDASVEQKCGFGFVYRSSAGVRDGQFFKDETVPEQLAHLLAAHSELNIFPAASFPNSPDRLNDELVEGHFGGVVFGDAVLNWSKHVRQFPASRWLIFEHFGDFQFLHQSWNKAYQQLLAQTGLELADEWPLEVYLQSPTDMEPVRPSAQIWLPIK